MEHLEDVDLSQRLGKKEEGKRLKVAQQRLLHLRLVLGGQLPVGEGEETLVGPPLCVVFEGWDASGKGGTIRRLVDPLDPRHVRVAQFAAPTPDEKRHHFLWRFWPSLPGRGGMAVFDRSWYGRVLVERVEGFASAEEWGRSYDEILHFEQALTAEGMILCKFWMHLSEAEQLRRFEARRDNPLKSWKLTDEDWRNREKRGAYEEAVDEMLDRTHQACAPWFLVAGESKRFARVQVIETVVAEIERGMEREGIAVPPVRDPGLD